MPRKRGLAAKRVEVALEGVVAHVEVAGEADDEGLAGGDVEDPLVVVGPVAGLDDDNAGDAEVWR